MQDTFLALWIGVLLDFLLGDPVYPFHPIRLIGMLIAKTEQELRNLLPKTKGGELVGGVLLTVIVIAVSAAIPSAVLYVCYRVHRGVYLIAASIFCYQLLAAKSLKTESTKVETALEAGDVEAARYAVSMIVGRDTKDLTAEGIAKAAVETVAENASDGCLAPMLYMMLFGPIGGFVYKAINTMDSMVGYRNEKYEYFGKTAAKLDDLANLIPSRVSALVMIAVCFGKNYNRSGAWHIFRRDRYCHKSPNSAQTEAVMAGALGLQLAGPISYFGKMVDKPTIGDRLREIEPEDIRRANVLLYRSVILMMVIYSAVVGIMFVI